ncbi:MAG: hypothetical protein PHD11_01885 [Bacteroidales bacterium]|nr:hypothetical protein [Bacteroidales bacterium]MDD4670107.1 hypothetical protein [Bacteroidales bacterium]
MGIFFKRSEKWSSNFKKANIIVFLFAIAHVVTCFLLHDTKVGDGFFLTILTIAMIFCLIRFYASPFDVFLGIALLGCFAGFYFGTTMGDYLTSIRPEWGVFNNMIVTFVTTEVLGFATILVIGKKSK